MAPRPLQGSAHRYFSTGTKIRVAQGVSGSVVDKGSLRVFVPYLTQGVKHGLQDAGIRQVRDIRRMLAEGTIRFEVRSPAAQVRGTPLPLACQRRFPEPLTVSPLCRAVRGRHPRAVLLRKETYVR